MLRARCVVGTVPNLSGLCAWHSLRFLVSAIAEPGALATHAMHGVGHGCWPHMVLVTPPSQAPIPLPPNIRRPLRGQYLNDAAYDQAREEYDRAVARRAELMRHRERIRSRTRRRGSASETDSERRVRQRAESEEQLAEHAQRERDRRQQTRILQGQQIRTLLDPSQANGHGPSPACLGSADVCDALADGQVALASAAAAAAFALVWATVARVRGDAATSPAAAAIGSRAAIASDASHGGAEGQASLGGAEGRQDSEEEQGDGLCDEDSDCGGGEGDDGGGPEDGVRDDPHIGADLCEGGEERRADPCEGGEERTHSGGAGGGGGGGRGGGGGQAGARHASSLCRDGRGPARLGGARPRPPLLLRRGRGSVWRLFVTRAHLRLGWCYVYTQLSTAIYDFACFAAIRYLAISRDREAEQGRCGEIRTCLDKHMHTSHSHFGPCFIFIFYNWFLVARRKLFLHRPERFPASQ